MRKGFAEDRAPNWSEDGIGGIVGAADGRKVIRQKLLCNERKLRGGRAKQEGALEFWK